MDAARVMDTKTADKVIVNEWNNTQQYILDESEYDMRDYRD